MDETPHRIVQEIDEARHHLDEDLMALRRRAEREAGWWLRLLKHPLWMAGAALAGALVLGFLIGRKARI